MDLKTRELVTLCFLVAQGGCDEQVRLHVAGNMNVGNDKAMLVDVLRNLIPYIGYPRVMNGLNAIEAAAE